jgi:hypothetical protein
MPAIAWWIGLAAAGLTGAIVGAWVTFRYLRTRFERELRRATDELHQRHLATADQLRAAQVRAQTELDQTRSSFKRQLAAAAAAAEPQAALQRTEARLKAAYAELDRLRAASNPEAGSADLADGFAVTRPLREGL